MECIENLEILNIFYFFKSDGFRGLPVNSLPNDAVSTFSKFLEDLVFFYYVIFDFFGHNKLNNLNFQIYMLYFLII